MRTSRGRRCGHIRAGPVNKATPKEHEYPSANDLHIYLRKIRMNLFLVNLQRNVCFDAICWAKGNVLDLWAGVHQIPLKEAAWYLAEALASSCLLIANPPPITR